MKVKIVIKNILRLCDINGIDIRMRKKNKRKREKIGWSASYLSMLMHAPSDLGTAFYPTTHPKVRYISSLAINFTYYYDLEALTILSICK